MPVAGRVVASLGRLGESGVPSVNLPAASLSRAADCGSDVPGCLLPQHVRGVSHVGLDPVELGGGGHEQGLAVGAAEAQVADLLGDRDVTDLGAFWVEHVHSVQGGAPHVAASVDGCRRGRRVR